MVRITRTWPNGKVDKKYTKLPNIIISEGRMNPRDTFVHALVHDFSTGIDAQDFLIVPRGGRVDIEYCPPRGVQ